MERNFSSLATVHMRSVDAKVGYLKMMEKAEPGFRPVVREFANLHAVHAQRLAGMLERVGEEPEDDGSFMATVHEAVVTVRSWFDAIDSDMMGQVKSGEDWILSAFDSAIDDGNVAAFTDELREMRGELSMLLARHLPAA